VTQSTSSPLYPSSIRRGVRNFDSYIASASPTYSASAIEEATVVYRLED